MVQSREERLAKDREEKKKRRANETPAQRAIRLAKMKEYHVTYRLTHKKEVAAYGKAYNQAHKKEAAAYRRKRKEENPEVVRETWRNHYANNKDKKKADLRQWKTEHHEETQVQAITNYAIKTGKLIPRPCVACSSTENVIAHHEDYQKPLDVWWLCRSHHWHRHNVLRSKARVEALLKGEAA